MRIGLDVGSTTLKCVVLGDDNEILFQSYERHFSQIISKTASLLKKIKQSFALCKKFSFAISGSAGMGLATSLGIDFVQEVYATRVAVTKIEPNTDCVIELGGEDAKILFLKGENNTDDLEVRMNGSCAGGTGSFIDQMASLLNVTPTELNELSKNSQKEYTIASRCGVFAKSDIQPLLNQGARKEDVASSIFSAVVNQTVSGLAQGREIKGNIFYLGGPLTYFSGLRKSFDKTLNQKGFCPENSLYFVAIGTAMLSSDSEFEIDSLIEKTKSQSTIGEYNFLPPLFTSENEYNEFKQRHNRATINTIENSESKNCFIGIDAGSTTLKAVAIDDDKNIIFSRYIPNNGNPIPLVKSFLQDFYAKYPTICVKGSCVTGYGEEMIKNAFGVDLGVVETIAHFTSAKHFMPNVDFIIDIGGQDIKCFKIKNGAIDNLFLNEACSSGCGSFLQTFAGALGYNIEDFANLGMYANKPVDLGSRCTVFMNSSVKQAQKDGASIENISAGLSMSVVKNALYKVIRIASADMLGDNIIVQGGTFLNDVVLRAFEMEIGHNVVRPTISGHMGAFGCALYAKEHCNSNNSTILTLEELKNFTHKVKTVNCGLCNNHCSLTINQFDGGRKFIGGNRCERPLKLPNAKKPYNMYHEKRKILSTYMTPTTGKRGTIGIPLVLNNFELLPFWSEFFKTLEIGTTVSDFSSRELYISGQQSIPSDTVCFPAKLVHGHIENLVSKGVNTIFYPCMSYNLDEKLGDNHFNCPVVGYYPEVINANMKSLNGINFIYDYIGLHNKTDFPKKIHKILLRYYPDITLKEVKKATANAFNELDNHYKKIADIGKEFIAYARQEKMPIIVLASRPYHIDPEISHGIDKLICDCKAVVITEDSLSYKRKKEPTNILNQWTYHSRLYSAARAIANQKDMNLVQLVSFGCGLDAVTTDEVREILEESGKLYTQIKIDEITNLGAVKIRLRSLFATM